MKPLDQIRKELETAYETGGVEAFYQALRPAFRDAVKEAAKTQDIERIEAISEMVDAIVPIEERLPRIFVQLSAYYANTRPRQARA